DLVPNEASAAALRVSIAMARGQALAQINDVQGAISELERAREVAEAMNAPGLVASVLAGLGAVLERGGLLDRAAGSYREAAQLAADAGDAEGSAIWHRMGRVSEARRTGS